MMNLGADIFENVIGFLGPQDLISVACVGPTSDMDPMEKVYMTDMMLWGRSVGNDQALIALMKSLPPPRSYEGENRMDEPIAFNYSSACNFAAASGKLDILKKLRADGFPWTSRATAHAAHGGHLATLTWAQENGCECNAETMDAAAANGDLGCINYLYHEIKCPIDIYMTYIAAKKGQLTFLTYACIRGFPVDATTCMCAADNGHFGCLMYLHDEGCAWNMMTPNCAAFHGHMKCLEYAHEQGCPWDHHVMSYAIQGKQLECIKYAYENSSDFDDQAATRAAAAGDLECFKYVIQHDCPWNPDKCFTVADDYGREEVADWIVREIAHTVPRGSHVQLSGFTTEDTHLNGCQGFVVATHRDNGRDMVVLILFMEYKTTCVERSHCMVLSSSMMNEDEADGEEGDDED